MMHTKRMAVIRVTPQLLRERLGLCDDLDIVGARWDFETQCTMLYLAGPNLPEVHEGEVIPEVNPEVIRRA